MRDEARLRQRLQPGLLGRVPAHDVDGRVAAGDQFDKGVDRERPVAGEVVPLAALVRVDEVVLFGQAPGDEGAAAVPAGGVGEVGLGELRRRKEKVRSEEVRRMGMLGTRARARALKKKKTTLSYQNSGHPRRQHLGRLPEAVQPAIHGGVDGPVARGDVAVVVRVDDVAREFLKKKKRKEREREKKT